jgi:hypothetical protein
MSTDDNQPEQKHPGGRPLKYETVEALDRAINAYFDMCDPHTQRRVVDCGINEKGETIWREREVMTEQRPYTISGLANALGVTRQTLLNYADREEFFDSIDRAKSRCEEYAEQQLFEGNANGAKFNLINNYRGKHQDWSDKHEIDHTTKDQPIPLLAGLAPATLVVEDEADDAGTAPADDSPNKDQ